MPLLIPGLGVLFLGAVVVLISARPQSVDGTIPERITEAHLHRTRVLAFTAGLASLLVSASSLGSLGRGFTVAPSVAGAVAMCLLALGERTIPVIRTETRRVDLAPRRVVDYVRTTTRAWVAVMLISLVAIFTLGWVTACSDDAGRTGRAVQWTTRDGGQEHSPWPGSFYSLPTLIALLISFVMFAGALRLVTVRPQVNADSRSAILDKVIRMRSAAVLQATLLCTLALTLCGFAFMTFIATSHASAGSPIWVTIAHWGALACVFLGLAGLVTAATQLGRR